MKLILAICGCALIAQLRAIGAEAPRGSQPTNARPAAISEKSGQPLRAGDSIIVQVFGEEDLTAKGVIEPNGTVNLPLLNAVRLQGKTPEEASKIVRDLYAAKYLVDPKVSVTVTEYAKYSFTILGQVRAPGLYQFPGSEKLNILQAIAKAQGFTRSGDQTKIVIKRVDEGHEKVIPVNVKAMLNKAQAELVEIHNGDTINVGETVF